MMTTKGVTVISPERATGMSLVGEKGHQCDGAKVTKERWGEGSGDHEGGRGHDVEGGMP